MSAAELRAVVSCDRCRALGFVCFAHASKLSGRVLAAFPRTDLDAALRRAEWRRLEPVRAATRAQEALARLEAEKKRRELYARQEEFAWGDCHHGKRRSDCPKCWRYCEPHNELACAICDPGSEGAPK